MKSLIWEVDTGFELDTDFLRRGGISRFAGLTRLRPVYGHIGNPSVIWLANTEWEKSFVNKFQKSLFTDEAKLRILNQRKSSIVS